MIKAFFFFCVLYFFPQFIDNVGLLLEQAFTIILFVLTFIYVCCFGFFNKKALLISFSYLFILLISLIRGADVFITGDFFELVKPLYFLSFYLFSFHYIKRYSEEKIDKLNDILSGFIYATFLLATLSILEAQSSFFNDVFNILYKENRSVLQYKAVASFISPYTFGSFLILPIFISYFLISYNIKKIESFIFMIVFIFGMFSTQSRTTLISFCIAIAFSFFLILICNWIKGRRKMLLFTFFTLFSILVSWSYLEEILIERYSYLYNGLLTVFVNFDLDNIHSLIYSTPSISNRYEQIIEVLEAQGDIPLIGAMIGKGEIYPESFYAMYLLRVGLLGLLAHLMLLVIGFFVSLKISYSLHLKSKFNMVPYFLGFSIYFISLFSSYFSSAVNDQTRTGFIFYSLLGLVFSLREKLKKDGDYFEFTKINK